MSTKRNLITLLLGGMLAATVAIALLPSPEAQHKVVAASASEHVLFQEDRNLVAMSSASPAHQEIPSTTTTAPPPTTTTTHYHRPTTTTAPPTQAPTPVASSSSGSGSGDPHSEASWERLAQCEAGGNWSTNTGNGYYGGLQFSLSSWQAVGGTGYPHEASRATQIAMGQRLHAQGGWKHWPGCSRKFGWI